MNILKTLLLTLGITLLVSACAEDTIGDNGSTNISGVDTRPTLSGPYIGDNNSQNYEYMKELAALPAYANGTSGHSMLKNYFGRGDAYYNRYHNNWFDWTQRDHNHGFVEDNIQVVPAELGANATKNGVRFPHSYHQDIAKYTDLIGNCTTNCHIRYDSKATKPFTVAPGNPDIGATHSKIVFNKKIQVGDSSYNNPAHNFCWTCHANLPKPTRAPHGFIITKDNVTHEPNGNCSKCHYYTLGDITEPAADTRAKADVQYYGRPDIRENNFGTKLPLDNTAAFNPEFAHTYADDNTTGKFNYTEAKQAGTRPAPTH